MLMVLKKKSKRLFTKFCKIIKNYKFSYIRGIHPMLYLFLCYAALFVVLATFLVSQIKRLFRIERRLEEILQEESAHEVSSQFVDRR